MMNRALLQRQMFANGGAAVPDEYKGFSKLPEAVQMKMDPALAQKYEQGGPVFDPNAIQNILRFFRDNPGATVRDYNNIFGTNLDPEGYLSTFEKSDPSGTFIKRPQPENYEEPVGTMGAIRMGEQLFAPGEASFTYTTERTTPQEASELQELRDIDERIEVQERGPLPIVAMQEGGVAGLMSQPNMAAMPMGSPSMNGPPMAAEAQVDPEIMMTALKGASEEVGDLEQAGDFKSMMDQFSGEDKSEEERRDDLAGIVGPEDAAQTPDSVLALVTPVVQISMLDQGIAPMAQEAMDTPVEGDMAGGIMSMTGAGNEPPVNFKYGGEVLRRGDEDPVLYFEKGKGVPQLAPMTDYQQQVGKTAKALLPTFQQFIPTTDPETTKKRLQSDILFDIADTFLAFSAPMEGEPSGLSAVQRLALATQKKQLLPKIQQRTAKSAADQKTQETAIKSGALQAALGLETARLKQVGTERVTSLKEAQENARTVKTLNFKRQEGVSDRAHKTSLANQKTQLEMALQLLEGKQDLTSIAAKATYKEALQRLEGEQKLNQIGLEHENKLEEISSEIIGKKDLAKINNIASLEEVLKKIRSTEGIEASKIKSRELIATEKNNTDKLINANNIEQKDRRLSFDKVRENNLVADRRAKNQQAIAELDLDKVTEARQTLEGLRDFELKKAAGERDDKKLALIEKELNEVKIAETEIRRFSAENKAENDAAVLAFKNKQLNKLVEYRTKANDLKSELNQITRTNNVVNQQFKEKELALKTHKAQLELFGSGATGKTLNLLSNATRYEAYRDGGTDNQFELAIQNYIAKTTSPTGETIEKELPPYLKEILVDRLEQGLRIPDIPLYKLGLTESRIQQLRPVSDEVGEEAMNTVIDEGVDLTQGTGVLSTVNTAMRWIAGQISEFGVGQGDVLTQTSSARKMLNALANSTEGFLRDAVSNDRLDKETIAIVRRDILRPTGTMTDANAYAQLKQTQQTIRAKLDEKRMILNNPREFTETQITKARESVIMMKNLINNYGIALRSYEKFGGFGKGSGGSEQLFKNIIKKRKTN
jgi:hypothetical protein